MYSTNIRVFLHPDRKSAWVYGLFVRSKQLARERFFTIYGSFAFFIFNTIRWANVAANICAEINLICGNLKEVLLGCCLPQGALNPQVIPLLYF